MNPESTGNQEAISKILSAGDCARILSIVAEHDCHESLSWNSSLEFSVNCSDVFCWGCADYEPITPVDVGMFEQAMREGGIDGPLLYCARRRELRPQGAVYKSIRRDHWPLFDACGPAREVGLVNPVAHPLDAKGCK